MKTISRFTNFGSNMLLQEAGGSSSGAKKKEHVWHKVWRKLVGPYGEMYGYVECLLCRDPDHWGYVIGYVDSYGFGYVDFDGDGYADNTPGGNSDYGWNDAYGDNGGYGDDYGYDGKGSSEGYGNGNSSIEPIDGEEIERVIINTSINMPTVKNGWCELGIMATQTTGGSMSELWKRIDLGLYEKYPAGGASGWNYYQRPNGVPAGSHYSQMSYQGQEIWCALQEARIEKPGIDENGNAYIDVAYGIHTYLLNEVADMLGAQGTSDAVFDPISQLGSLMTSIAADQPYYTSLARQTVDENGNPVNGNSGFGHSVAIIGYIRGITSGYIYGYIISDPVYGEVEVAAD